MSIMRRHLYANEKALASILISASGLKINLNPRKAYRGGEDLDLTPKQFSRLNALGETMGKVVTKEDLYQLHGSQIMITISMKCSNIIPRN